MQKSLIGAFFLSLAFFSFGQTGGGTQVLFSENFEGKLDRRIWKVEMDPSPGSYVKTEKGSLVLNTAGGVTVWLNKVLSGNIEISYTRKIVKGMGENDRVSDLNQFWMATDPKNKNLFTRTGKFSEYDNLSMYYVGVGGNTNTTTRFRQYSGTGVRKILQEHLDKPHLLEGNLNYRIKIRVLNKTTQFYVNDKLFFSQQDEKLLKRGISAFAPPTLIK